MNIAHTLLLIGIMYKDLIALSMLLCATFPLPFKANGDTPDQTELQGSWRQVSRVSDGERKVDKSTILTFDHKRFDILEEGKSVESGMIAVDVTRKPKGYSVTILDKIGNKSETYNGIYRIEGDTLRTCVNTNAGQSAPTEFEAGKGSKAQLIVWKKLNATEIDGTWKLTKYFENGTANEEIVKQNYIIVRKGGLQEITKDGKPFSKTWFEVDASHSPKHIDFIHVEDRDQQPSILGVYELNDDVLKVALLSTNESTARPKKIEQEGTIVAIYERIKSKQ